VFSSDDLSPTLLGKRRRNAEGFAVKSIVAAIATFAATTVTAQESAPAPSAVSDTVDLEEVIVTGTSIRREDNEALPVTTLSTEEMDLRDAGTPVDLLTSLPAVTGVPMNESNQGGAGARGDVAGIAMRGLGTGATLVLLNGRRMAAHGIASGTTMAVNANTMPVRGLERVDILRDGASSIYGSDAVAGVVNFIVDNKLVGDQVEVQAGMAEIGSGDDRRITLTHGDFYFGGRMHWTSTFDAYDRDALESEDVGGDADKVARAPYGFNAVNGAFFDRNASSQYPIFTVDGLGKRYMVPAGSGTAYVSDTAPDRAGEYSRDAYFDMNTGYALPETTRFNWFNQFDYELNDRTTLFGELLLYSAQSTMERAPVAYSSTADSTITIAADNPFNPYGADVTLNNYRFVDNGNERVKTDTLAYRLVAGVRGDLGDRWNWESAATYSRNRTRDISQNAIRESALQEAIEEGLYNPFGYNFEVDNGVVTPTSAYTNDPDVIATFSQHFKQTGRDILTTVDGRVTGELFDIWAGSVDVAMGGEYRYEDYALYRPQYVGLNGDDNALGLDADDNDFVQASPVANILDTRGVGAGFLETVIPLAAPYNEIPGLYSLSIGASVRYEHYDDFGSTTNPKFTLDYRPVEAVMIRASYNEGFRAPNLAMINYQRTTTTSYTDPYREGLTGGDSAPRLQTTGAVGTLDAETSKGSTLGLVVDLPWVEGLHFSVDYFSIKMDDVIATPNASQIRNDDAERLREATQAALAAGQSIDQIDLGSGTDDYAGNPNVIRDAVTAEDREVFDAYNAEHDQADWLAPVGTLVNTYTPFTNADKQEVVGYDFNITYSMPSFGWGKVLFSTDWTYLDKFTQTGGLTGVSSVLLGTDGNARLRGSASATWSLASWSAGLSAYYIGEYADTSAVFNPDADWSGSLPGYVKTVDGVNYWKVKDSVTVNGFVSKTLQFDSPLLNGTSIRLGVKNLFDKAPPLTSDTGGYDAAVYNSVAMGRMWTLRLSKSF